MLMALWWCWQYPTAHSDSRSRIARVDWVSISLAIQKIHNPLGGRQVYNLVETYETSMRKRVPPRFISNVDFGGRGRGLGRLYIVHPVRSGWFPSCLTGVPWYQTGMGTFFLSR